MLSRLPEPSHMHRGLDFPFTASAIITFPRPYCWQLCRISQFAQDLGVGAVVANRFEDRKVDARLTTGTPSAVGLRHRDSDLIHTSPSRHQPSP